jgi:hypothetical protein
VLPGKDCRFSVFLLYLSLSLELKYLGSEMRDLYCRQSYCQHKHNRSSTVAVQGLVFVAHSLYIHTVSIEMHLKINSTWNLGRKTVNDTKECHHMLGTKDYY